MALSIVNGKVQLKSDDDNWYEFPLERILDTVHHGDITLVATPPVGADEKAVIEASNGELYDAFLFTYDGRTYLDIGQTPSSDPETEAIQLPVDGQDYKMDLQVGSDGRVYYRWIVAYEYAAGYVYLDLTAEFYKMGRTLTIREGDDARDIRFLLTEKRRTLTTAPDRVIMKVDMESSGIQTRELTDRSDIKSGVWAYRLSDSDFEIFASGSYSVQLYGYWEDGTQATWPTKPSNGLTLIVESKLDTELD